MVRRKRARPKPKAEVTLVDKATTWSPALYEVHRDRALMGFLEKRRDTRDETHPWVARSVGFVPGHRPMAGDVIGFFYAHDGGKQAAIQAIMAQENPGPTMENPAKLDELINEIEDFYRQMHHNASTLHLSGRWEEPPPHLASAEVFDEFLSVEAEDFTRALSEYVKGKYGEELTFSQYGRGGATILPDQWVWETTMSGRGIDIDKAVGHSQDYESELERYNRARKVLKILKDVNKRIESAVVMLPERWKDFIEANR